PILLVTLLLVPWPASGAMPGVARWAALEKMRGIAHLVRARRASHRQRRHVRHASQRAVEAGQLESARTDKAGEPPEQRSSASHRSPLVGSEAPSAKQRAAREKLAPRSLSKTSPAHPAAPSVPIKPPEVGKPGPGGLGAKEPPQPTVWSNAEVI